MTKHTISRRRILKLSGTGLAAGLAGCTGSGSGGDGTTPTQTPTETSHHSETGHHEESGHSHGSAAGAPVEHATVKMVTNDSGYHFEPHVAWVKPGGTVTWKLESGSHTTTAYHPKNDRPLRIPDGAASWDSGLLSEQGATFEHTFETEGVYDYYCAPHEAMGMLGSVIVGKPEAHGQPGLAAPQPSLPKTAQAKIKELNEMVNEALGHTHETEQTHDDHHKKSFGGWFEKTENYEGVHDKTGQEQVTVTVGAPDVAGGPMAFDPAAIRIDPGTDVVWQWTGAGSGHNVVDKTGGSKDVPMTDKDDAEFVSGKPVDKKGHTFSYTFEKPGTTHKYYCMPHNAEGMRGVIEVADSS